MKKIFYITLLVICVACEDTVEVTHRYSRLSTNFKTYPIYLDAREILADIQVKPSVNPHEVIKIAANDKYFFVGESMRGIHVFEKIDDHRVKPLCFIECRYIKAFDVVDNMLYCNNFVDLLVIDVENPLQAKILHREKDYFNKYGNSSFNFPVIHNSSINSNVYFIGNQHLSFTVTVTDANPEPDLSAYDKLYENIVVKEVSEALLSGRPYAGIVNVEGKIYTLETNSLVQVSYTDDDLFNSNPAINNFNYFSVIPTSSLKYKDGIIFVIGDGTIVFFDYFNTQNRGFFSTWNSSDVVALKETINSFVVLNNNFSILGVTLGMPQNISGNGSTTFGATSIINVDDYILALGTRLTIHRFHFEHYLQTVERVRDYSNISGLAMLRDGDHLYIANRQGLFVYDISDLENIILIP